jgi:hypothetical protein
VGGGGKAPGRAVDQLDSTPAIEGAAPPSASSIQPLPPRSTPTTVRPTPPLAPGPLSPGLHHPTGANGAVLRGCMAGASLRGGPGTAAARRACRAQPHGEAPTPSEMRAAAPHCCHPPCPGSFALNAASPLRFPPVPSTRQALRALRAAWRRWRKSGQPQLQPRPRRWRHGGSSRARAHSAGGDGGGGSLRFPLMSDR